MEALEEELLAQGIEISSITPVSKITKEVSNYWQGNGCKLAVADAFEKDLQAKLC